MRLLIVTQKVDSADRNLGFFVSWIREFAKHCEEVTVICLEKGEYSLPANVRVFSLGKKGVKIRDSGFRILRRIVRALRFLDRIWRERARYDAVFVHMIPEYVLWGGLFWKLMGKKVALWYVHQSVSWRLRLAEFFVDRIFTASPESFRLRSGKVKVVGHGISLEEFPVRRASAAGQRLVTVGRISPVKDLRTLIAGFLILKKQFPSAEFSLIGEPITDSDRRYATGLRQEFPDAVRFRGGMAQKDIYAGETYDAFVHASRTGSMDKAVLEALAAGLPVVTSSEAFSADIPGIVKFRAGDADDLAAKLSRAFAGGFGVTEGAGRAYVEAHHGLGSLIPRILSLW